MWSGGRGKIQKYAVDRLFYNLNTYNEKMWVSVCESPYLVFNCIQFYIWLKSRIPKDLLIGWISCDFQSYQIWGLSCPHIPIFSTLPHFCKSVPIRAGGGAIVADRCGEAKACGFVLKFTHCVKSCLWLKSALSQQQFCQTLVVSLNVLDPQKWGI